MPGEMKGESDAGREGCRDGGGGREGGLPGGREGRTSDSIFSNENLKYVHVTH